MPYINTCQTGLNWGGMGLTSSPHPSVCRRPLSQCPFSRACRLSLQYLRTRALKSSVAAGRLPRPRAVLKPPARLTPHKLRSPHALAEQSQSAPQALPSLSKPRSEIPPPALSRRCIVVPRTSGTQAQVARDSQGVTVSLSSFSSVSVPLIP